MEVVVFCIAIMKRFQGHFMFFLPFGFELAEATLNQGLHLSLPPPKLNNHWPMNPRESQVIALSSFLKLAIAASFVGGGG